MKKRLVRTLLALSMASVLTITIPNSVIVLASSTDTSNMSDEEVYEKAHKYAYKKYNYEKAAELLRTIEEYKNSKELAERYEAMKNNRYIGERFYWYPEEYALLLKQNIKTLGQECTSEVTDETEDENDETIDTITIAQEEKEETTVKLYDVKTDGSFKKIEIATEDGSSLTYPSIVAVSTARGDKTISDAKDLMSDLLDSDPHGDITKDGLLYSYDNDGLTMTVTIEPEEKEDIETTSTNTYESKSSSSSSSSTSTAYSHYCEKDGCYKEGTHEITGFSGQPEYYCDQHYQDIQNMIGMMEEDVGTGSASQHQCEVSGCNKEGTNPVGSEWYCTQHYQEMIDMVSGMYESTYGY